MTVKIRDIVAVLEKAAPLAYQESYDNSGLLCGDLDKTIQKAVVSLDITENVIDEAISEGCDLIISHHPLTMNGFKKLTGRSEPERCLVKAVKNDVAIYSGHTNFDSIEGGVSSKLAEKLGLQNCRILSADKGSVMKLVTFIPEDHLSKVSNAIFGAGAGCIGNYDSCSFVSNGTGSFRGNEASDPYVGKKGEVHFEKEARFECIFPAHIKGKVIHALKSSHPYEEVAYDLYLLENKDPRVGFGMIGSFASSMKEKDFLLHLKKTLNLKVFRHSPLTGNDVMNVAVCGGSGSFLIHDAIRAGADAFITGDLKYHQFSEPQGKMILADIGHYESEIFITDYFYNLIKKNFPTFAVHFSKVKTNPVNYY